VRDVLPRDGFQDLDYHVPAPEKLAVIVALHNAGHRWIEVTSMVRPEWVPQFADAEAVLGACGALPGLCRSVFVPNRRGLDRALAIGCEEVSFAVATTDALSRANFNRDRDAMLGEVLGAAAAARAAGARASITIGGAFGCPYEGDVALDTVLGIADSIAGSGVDVVFLADTIGSATVGTVAAAFSALTDRHPELRLGVHLHGGPAAVDRVDAAIDAGASIVDVATAGLGGCPFVPSAPGNVPAEVVVARLAARGIPCDLDPSAAARAAAEVARILEEVRRSVTAR
jgi:isopropylmalate/homocitrate/citramalate synthase